MIAVILKRFRIATGTGMILLMFFCSAPCLDADALTLFRIGTGGRTGVYYPVGKLIAQGITGTAPKVDGEVREPGEYGIQGVIGVAQNSAGSVENARRVASGELEAGLVQADVASWAVNREKVFENDASVTGIRAIASLYPEKFQIVVRKDAGIRSVNDLRGKRISVDEIGSGTLGVMRIVLESHQMTENDLLPVYLKPVFTQDKMVSGDLQGFVMMAGAPMAAVNQLLDVGITLVPIAPRVAFQIQSVHPYLVPGTISKTVYSGIPDTPTLQVHALLVVNASMDNDLVYRITQALWSRRTLSLLAEGHPQGRAITPGTALSGISIPIHPGAASYYREHRDRFGETGL